MSNDADSDITLTRSPRSPSETLKDAIDRAEKLLAGLGRGAGPVEAVAKAIGFGGLSGASRSSLASLTSYGFLTKQGNNYRISDLALRILRPLNPADRIAAIAEAQSSPKLFAEIQQDHPEASAASVAKTTQAETKSNTTSVSQSPAISANELPVPIGEGRVARVPFPMSEEDFDLVIGTLNLWKKKLTAKPTKPIETMDVD
jgi:hypothetical protein